VLLVLDVLAEVLLLELLLELEVPSELDEDASA
jgi:hypothetical protein